MACIVFYSPFNQRSRDTESLMIAFRDQGHNVISLTQQEGKEINEFLNSKGIGTYSHVIAGKRSGWWYYIRHLLFFIRFCRKHNAEIVYSHLEPANFVASVGQYFVKAKTFLCRHHVDEGLLYKFDQDLYYKLTYTLATRIIVVSSRALRFMVEYENVPVKKINHINLAYDFGLYPNPDHEKVTQIKSQYEAQILLLAACRFTEYKRPDLAIKLVKGLTDHGLDAKLILLGKGELENNLHALTVELGLQNRVFMPGYVNNILDFMGAADFFVHPSLLDASCVSVKEAGLVELPVIVCSGVGDFDDYIVHSHNGFLADQQHFVTDATEIILNNFRKNEHLKNIGKNLKRSVLDLFSIQNVIPRYDALNR